MIKKSNLLKIIWEWLTGNSEYRQNYKNIDFYPLDCDKISEELQIRSEAARLAAAGLPNADSLQLTGAEERIIHYIEKARLDYVNTSNLRLSVLNDNLLQLDIRSNAQETLQLGDEFSRKASSLLDENEKQIKDLVTTAQRQAIQLDEFKRKNRLTRDAHYPTGSRLFFQYTLFAFLILLEGGLNAYLFAKGSDSGLIGGFFMAMLSALFNMVVAGIQGRYTIPFVNHRNPLLKIFGFLSCLIAISLMLSIGLGIAHYRDALSLDVANPERTTLLFFSDNLDQLFQLHDIFSWLLLGVSLLFAIFALFDSFYLSDSYPFYGTKTKRYLESQQEADTEIESLREELEGLKNDFLEKLDDNVKKITQDIERRESIIQNKIKEYSKLDSALKNAEHCMRALIGTFRQENQIHRNRLPTPEYFNTMFELKALNLPDFTLNNNQQDLDNQKELFNTVISQFQSIKASIQAAFNREFDRLQPLNSHISNSNTNSKMLIGIPYEN